MSSFTNRVQLLVSAATAATVLWIGYTQPPAVAALFFVTALAVAAGYVVGRVTAHSAHAQEVADLSARIEHLEDQLAAERQRHISQIKSLHRMGRRVTA